MIKIIIIILIAEIWNTIGQIFFKKSANMLKIQSLRGVVAHIRFALEILSNRMIWLGIGAQALGVVTWFAALAGADLSIVSPLGSMQYILVLVSAHFFLGERINPLKLAGTLLVVCGIILVAIS